MLTSSSLANVVTSAITPGLSGTGTRTSAISAIDATRGRQIHPSSAGASEHVEQRLAIARLDDLAHPAQRRLQLSKRGHDRTAVLGADVGPDPGMTGGDAGHVAKPAGGEQQAWRGALRRPRPPAPSATCSEMWNMGHDGNESVVPVGCELDDLGAE